MRNFLRFVFVLMVFYSGTAFARTPIETFIFHVKEGHEFTPIVNLWQPDNDFSNPSVLTVVSHAQTLRLDYGQLATFMNQKNFAITLTLPGIGGGSYTLEMARYDFRSDGFTVHVDGGNGQGRDIYDLPGLYYRGVVKDIPGSIAAFSFFNDQVYGMFSIPGVGNFIIGSNAEGGDSHYILYNSNDLLHPDMAPKCEADELNGPLNTSALERTTSKVGEKLLNTCKQVRVFEQADFYTYQKKGSVTGVVKYVTSLFNCQSLIYKNEGVIISLKYLQIDTATDIYHGITSTNSSDWLRTFSDQTKNNLHGANLGILLSTINAYMGGVAWISQICNGYNSGSSSGPYAFCDVDGTIFPSNPLSPPTLSYYWDVNVTTHEMGHILGSPHTHGCYWNGNNTAIDGCYTIEGSCGIPTPKYPTGGGTIMSYCHLVSGVGVNFSNGFGPQPGNIIRNGGSRTCDTIYVPNFTLNKAGKTFTANSECTDPNGITYYWYDSNTANQADDILIAMVKKAGNNIGSIDSPGFTISVSTLAGYGSGTGQTTNFPKGTSYIGANTSTLNRYWKIAATKVPASAVEVIFPFTNQDTSDMVGSAHWSPDFSYYKMYTTNGSIDPNPANDFPGAIVSNFNLYGYGTSPSTTTWSYTAMGNLNLAHIKMSTLSGGASLYYTSGPTSLYNANGTSTGITVYPNPFSNHLSVTITKDNSASMELYTADGKLALTQALHNGLNTVNIINLPSGMYFYRIVGTNDVYTGKLERQ